MKLIIILLLQVFLFSNLNLYGLAPSLQSRKIGYHEIKKCSKEIDPVMKAYQSNGFYIRRLGRGVDKGGSTDELFKNSDIRKKIKFEFEKDINKDRSFTYHKDDIRVSPFVGYGAGLIISADNGEYKEGYVQDAWTEYGDYDEAFKKNHDNLTKQSKDFMVSPNEPAKEHHKRRIKNIAEQRADNIMATKRNLEPKQETIEDLLNKMKELEERRNNFSKDNQFCGSFKLKTKYFGLESLKWNEVMLKYKIKDIIGIFIEPGNIFSIKMALAIKKYLEKQNEQELNFYSYDPTRKDKIKIISEDDLKNMNTNKKIKKYFTDKLDKIMEPVKVESIKIKIKNKKLNLTLNIPNEDNKNLIKLFLETCSYRKYFDVKDAEKGNQICLEMKTDFLFNKTNFFLDLYRVTNLLEEFFKDFEKEKKRVEYYKNKKDILKKLECFLKQTYYKKEFSENPESGKPEEFRKISYDNKNNKFNFQLSYKDKARCEAYMKDGVPYIKYKDEEYSVSRFKFYDRDQPTVYSNSDSILNEIAQIYNIRKRKVEFTKLIKAIAEKQEEKINFSVFNIEVLNEELFYLNLEENEYDFAEKFIENIIKEIKNKDVFHYWNKTFYKKVDYSEFIAGLRDMVGKKYNIEDSCQIVKFFSKNKEQYTKEYFDEIYSKENFDIDIKNEIVEKNIDLLKYQRPAWRRDHELGDSFYTIADVFLFDYTIDFLRKKLNELDKSEVGINA